MLWAVIEGELVEVRRDATTRVVHTFFEGRREGHIHLSDASIEPDRAAFYALEIERCGLPSCPARGELHVIDGLGTWTYRTEISEVSPHFGGLLESSAAILTHQTPDRRPQSFVVNAEGVQHTFEPGVVVDTTVPTEDGWWAAVVYEEPDVFPTDLAFASLVAPVRRVRSFDRSRQFAVWRGYWLVLGPDALEIVGPNDSRAISLSRVAMDRRLSTLTDDLFLISGSDGSSAVVRPEDEAVAVFPTGDFGGVRAEVSPSGRYVVFSRGGRPLYRVDGQADPFAVESLEQADLFPDGSAPFEDAGACATPAQVDDQGQLSYGVRRRGASGWYRQTQDGLRLVGQPAHSVVAVSGRSRGATSVVRAVSNRSACPLVEPWPEPVPEVVLPVDRLLLVSEGREDRLLPQSANIRGLDPGGRCLVWTRSGSHGTEFVLTDVERGEEHAVRLGGGGLRLTYPFSLFHLP